MNEEYEDEQQTPIDYRVCTPYYLLSDSLYFRSWISSRLQIWQSAQHGLIIYAPIISISTSIFVSTCPPVLFFNPLYAIHLPSQVDTRRFRIQRSQGYSRPLTQ